MAGTVVDDIVRAVIMELSQVPGVATQVYSADRIRQFVQDAYQMEIDEVWWPRYMHWQTIAIDPATGLLVDDIKGPISFVDDFDNIRAVFPSGSHYQIPEFPQSLNPDVVSNGGRIFVTPDYTIEHRPFKVLPVGKTGSVTVHARQGTPLPLISTDKVYLDALLLQFDAAWAYCVDDGTVPAQVNKFQMLAAKRRQRLIAALAQQPLALDPRYPAEIQTDFFVLDQDPLA